MGQLHTVAPPVGIGPFLLAARTQIMAAWRAEIREIEPVDVRPAGSLATRLPEVLDQIADLAEQVMRGEPLQRTFEAARQGPLAGIDEVGRGSSVVVGLSVLRRCIMARWPRAPSEGGDRELRAVDVAIDAITAATVWQYEQSSRAGLEHAQMRSIVERTSALIWIKDVTGRIVMANHRLADAFDLPYEDVVGHRSEELLPAEVAARHRAHDQIVLRENRAVEEEETVPTKDGIRTFLALKFPLPGDPPMVGAIATEITDRKRMEEQLRVAVRAREDVLAVVSHDLRNPLGTIQLSVATLLNQLASDPRSRRFLEIVQRSCLRMQHLIDDLLDMSSIVAGSLSLETKPERADDVAREALELHQPLADEKGIALARRGTPNNAFIDCDRDRVMQVFANLIGNALKFCRAGDTVTLGWENAGAAVRFWVQDTGPGIQPALVGHLFDPYWSGPGRRGGAGLGLYIARGIVERHKGRIDVESAIGCGTRFSFTVPMAVKAG